MSWLFKGRHVTIEAPCLDCGEPMLLVMRDGVIDSAEPDGMFAYVNKPIRNWRPNLADS